MHQIVMNSANSFDVMLPDGSVQTLNGSFGWVLNQVIKPGLVSGGGAWTTLPPLPCKVLLRCANYVLESPVVVNDSHIDFCGEEGTTIQIDTPYGTWAFTIQRDDISFQNIHFFSSSDPNPTGGTLGLGIPRSVFGVSTNEQRPSADNFKVRDCEFSGKRLRVINFPPLSSPTLQNNSFEFGLEMNGFRFENNYIHDFNYQPVRVTIQNKDAYVRGNRFDNVTGEKGPCVEIANSRNLVVSHNHFRNYHSRNHDLAGEQIPEKHWTDCISLNHDFLGILDAVVESNTIIWDEEPPLVPNLLSRVGAIKINAQSAAHITDFYLSRSNGTAKFIQHVDDVISDPSHFDAVKSDLHRVFETSGDDAALLSLIQGYISNADHRELYVILPYIDKRIDDGSITGVPPLLTDVQKDEIRNLVPTIDNVSVVGNTIWADDNKNISGSMRVGIYSHGLNEPSLSGPLFVLMERDGYYNPWAMNVRNLAITGNTIRGIETGISVFRNKHISIGNNTISGNRKNGIYLGYVFESSITGNTVLDNEANGIFMRYYTENCIVSANTLTGNGCFGIHVSLLSTGNAINANNCSHGLTGILVGGNITSEETAFGSDATDYCKILSSSENQQCIDNKISGNICRANENHGVHLMEYSNSNAVTDNDCSGNKRGIVVVHSSRNAIVKNRCVNNTREGMHLLAGADFNTVNDNICEGNGEGIVIQGGRENRLSANTSADSESHGIRLSASEENLVEGNRCSRNSGRGILVSSSSNENKIFQNICYANTGYEISIQAPDCNENVVIANTCTNHNWWFFSDFIIPLPLFTIENNGTRSTVKDNVRRNIRY